MFKLFPAGLALMVTSSFNLTGQSTWSLDGAHSNIQFSITHLMVSDIEGSIQIKEATLITPDEDFSGATVSLVADMSTIDTDNDGRDEHLRSAEFFDTEKYPDMTFRSESFKKVADNKYIVAGALTFHGITKVVILDAIANKNVRSYDNKTIVGFKVNGIIKRTDFGIAITTPSAMLSDEVMVRGNVIFEKE